MKIACFCSNLLSSKVEKEKPASIYYAVNTQANELLLCTNFKWEMANGKCQMENGSENAK